jgi:4-hydroxybenzoate polyprenyltransferase
MRDERSNLYWPWLRLIRVPNLLTVPGDPLAGFLLASAGAAGELRPLALAAAAGASCCLYVFGLILNDLMDLEADLRERPERPLPAGEITVPQARMAAIAMGLSGLNLALVAGRASLAVAAALAALICLYDSLHARSRVVGLAAVGLCRGLSLLLGASAARPELFARWDVSLAPVWVAVAGLSVTVMGISAVARREAEAGAPAGAARWAPFGGALATLLGFVIAASASGRLSGLAPTVYVFLTVMTLMRAWLLGGVLYRLQPVPVTVGGHIQNLLMLQACFCVGAGPAGVLPAVTLVLLSLVFAKLSKRFYSS